MLPAYWALLLLFAIHGLGIWMAVNAVMKGRTPQGTIAWALSLLFVPWLAFPFYLVLRDRRFVGYVRADPRGSRAIDELARSLARSIRPFSVAVPPAGSADQGLTALAGSSWTRGNDVHLLIDGHATFDAIVNAIDTAADYVAIQFYTIRNDGLGTRLQQALISARRRGVRVYFLFDEFGSHALPATYLHTLTSAGCECTGFRAKSQKRRRAFRVNFRNHRKIVIVDGRVAFVGGHNVGDEYLSLHRRLTPWRDTHVAIQGPAVQCVQLAFAEDWFWARSEVPVLEWSVRASVSGDACVLIVPSTPADLMETSSLLYTQLADSAQARLWLSSAYFVPDEPVVAALQLAALRGVDVSVLIPEIADRVLPKLSSLTYYQELFPAGVNIHRYQAGFLHQKVALSDAVACVSTANLDNRSFRLNFEISVLVSDTAFASEVAHMLEVDFSNSRRAIMADYESRPYWFRFSCRLSRLLAPIQ